jgi:hypothetical protein
MVPRTEGTGEKSTFDGAKKVLLFFNCAEQRANRRTCAMTPTPTLALHTSRRGKRLVLLAALTGFIAFLSSLLAGAQPEQGRNVRIMTQNMNIGNLGTITRAPPDTLPAAFAKFYTETVATKPKDRAATIAKEIKNKAPDLVALQEVGILRKGSGATPNDPNIPATEVVHDQLQLLRAALSELGEHYDTVAVIPNSDAQLPSTLGFVVRVTDRTVILARAPSNRLKLSNVQVEQFWRQPAVSSQLTGRFGWGSVDVEVSDRRFRFASTHLTPVELSQPELIAIQKAQALELIQSAGKPDLPGGPFFRSCTWAISTLWLGSTPIRFSSTIPAGSTRG